MLLPNQLGDNGIHENVFCSSPVDESQTFSGQNHKPKPKTIFAFLAAVLVFAFLIFNFIFRPQTEPGPDLGAFAQCLTDQGALMYGTYWCPLCSRQKAMFGDAWQFIGYVECTEDPQRCILAGVQGYPTWVFQDGLKLVGMQPLELLAQASGCALPEG
jgi:hypothetical protein